MSLGYAGAEASYASILGARDAIELSSSDKSPSSRDACDEPDEGE